MGVADIALLCGAGLLGGFVNSIAGGGSLLVFPALVATGLGTVAANVTNSVALWPGYVGTLFGLGPLVNTQTRRARQLAVVASLGSAVGCAVLLLTPARAFTVVVPFLVIGASILVAAQPAIARRTTTSRVSHPRALTIAVGAGAVYGGYFGGGLGVILLAVIGLTIAVPLRETNALKSIISLIVATVALVAFAVFGPVHWLEVAIVAPTALLGGVLGGRLAAVVNERLLRVAIVVFGLAIGTWLAVRAFR
ncbi:MAG TPA: sulfite exporter TauE/SafE family protein [Jatrophihabitantaceae bacterium]